MIFDILAKVLTVVAVGLFLEYLTTAALRAKPTIDAATGARIFSYGRPSKALSLVSLILPVFFGAISLALYRAGESDYPIWLIVCLICAAMSGSAMLEFFVTRLIVSGEGITSLSPWTGERFFGWDEIELFSYSKFSGSFVLIGPYRKKIYASKYLNGFKYLTAEFRNRIHPDKWKYNYKESLSFS